MAAQFYKLRFQIEFCIRDAKQFCGPGDFLPRKYAAMGFAINLSFAALNMAKLIIHKENLAISIGRFHLIMKPMATAFRLNSTYAGPPNPKIMAKWDVASENWPQSLPFPHEKSVKFYRTIVLS